MSSADKVALVDTVNGANLCTLAAGGAKIVVYRCEIVHNGYSTGGTVFLTLAAGDTAVNTHLAHVSTLLVVGAFYDDTGGVLYHLYNTVRAGASAKATADTLDRVDLGNAALVDLYRA